MHDDVADQLTQGGQIAVTMRTDQTQQRCQTLLHVTQRTHHHRHAHITTSTQHKAMQGYGLLWCGVVWCGVVWCGVVWCGVWCGVEWSGVEWCGMVWCVMWWCLVCRG